MTKRRGMSSTKRLKFFLDHDGVCHICGGKIQNTDRWEVSHLKPLGMAAVDRETGVVVEDLDVPENQRPAHYKCHRDLTAKVDVPMIRKAQKIERKHRGAHVPKSPMRKKPPGMRYDWSQGRYIRD